MYRRLTTRILVMPGVLVLVILLGLFAFPGHPSAVSVALSAPPAPTPAPTGAALTGKYRNVFAEWGQSTADIDAKVNAAYQSLFNPSGTGTVYYETGTDMAYVKDIGNNDIRSEGMSYGLMITVMMNDQVKFNKLWKFVKTHMQCPNAQSDFCGVPGQRDGYTAWHLDPEAPFKPLDPNPAPDGEEYFATALLFAAGRWGSGTGLLNYQAEAQTILDAMLKDDRPNVFHSMFNLDKKLVVFGPGGSSFGKTDPSYHLPAFYEVWARYDGKAANRAFWAAAADASRQYWSKVMGDRTNGLFPDCTDLDGTPVNGCAGGTQYSFDAWRVISNVAVDWAWWAGDPNGAPLKAQTTWADQLQAFFGAKRPSYTNEWKLDGTGVGMSNTSTGQIAMNAVAGLAGSTSRVWDFASDVWQLSAPTGKWRYYDGLLYMVALLHLSGKFQMYGPGTPNVSGTAAP